MPHFHPEHRLTPAEERMLRPAYWMIVMVGTLAAALAVVAILGRSAL